MADLLFQNIGIEALSAAVPSQTIDNKAYTQYFDKDSVANIVEKTGINFRRFAPANMTASDLAMAAAEKLFLELPEIKGQIDVLIFVSQTPDYRMPATAVTLQHRLDLPNSVAAFDISLGCSAFIYALTVAYGYAQQPHIRKVLLLDAETRSRVYSAKDRNTAFLFGDAAIAAIISKTDTKNKSWFSLGSDGSRSHLIKMDAGGYRKPSTPETLTEKIVDEYGNIRTEEHGYMNGADVFNFVLREIPPSINHILKLANKNLAQLDYYLFHQANAFMNQYLAKKLKLDFSKIPSCLEDFGNTSSVSIPLTMVYRLKNKLKGHNELLLSGFGVGMSWATAIVELDDVYIADIVELNESNFIE